MPTTPRTTRAATLSLPALLPALLLVAQLLPAQAAPAAPAPAPGTSVPITLSGELRARGEWDRSGAALPNDAFTYLRARLGLRADPTPGVRVFLQVQDARVLGTESSSSAAAKAADVMELHQGYLELATPWRSSSVSARVGRQEISFGNERLVGAAGWTNLGRSFDGARVSLAPRGAKAGAEPWTATAFAAVVDERGRHFGPAAPAAAAADHAVAALYATRALPGGALLDATALWDAGASYRSYVAADRGTLDGRLRVPRALGAPVRVELEGAYQAGRQRSVAPGDTTRGRTQDVGAWLAGARIGTPTAPGRASLALGADLLSGDATPGDGRYSAFSTMYATNHPFYGLMDVIGDPAASTKDRGLVDALATAALPFGDRTTLRGEVHHFALATGGDRTLGWEGDAVLPVRLGSTATMDVGYALFRAGSGARAVGLGASGSVRHWVYLQLGVAF
jgi:Alginate export